ncbi:MULTISPECIES: hypothetical protein [Gluconobacter]|uniref:Uncharacterized protein n=1 Tax=Gluconobacter cadivus TaxID=2728101 RepID=A0ABR9Z0Y5_9PROT|nr:MULTISPECIES: hypothetical protein [Gluconobacter]MBF0889762.1 hypothetical protein [Gluconobacter cadivus]MBS1061341.1 hypothetical protein [Gluconobacter sp. Dm-44]
MGGNTLMGSSGSGAGGGSGGYGSGGGGGTGDAGGGGMGAVTLRGGALSSADPGRAAAFEAIAKVYGKLPKDYLSFLVSDPGVASAYEAMFRLGVMLTQDKSWDGVERGYGVDAGPGCLARLASVLASDTGDHAVSPALQAPLKAAILDFFLRVVGDNPAIRNRGDAAQVLAATQADAFARTSNLFLGSFLYENLRLEGKNLNKPARSHLNDFAMAQSDAIVTAFDSKFRHKAWQDIPQASFPHMVKILAGEPEWTANRLRAKVRP